MTKFPLEHAPFPSIRLSDTDRKNVVELADMFVSHTIEDYEAHLTDSNGIVDTAKWVRIKQFEDVVVFQDREALKERRLSRVNLSRDRAPANEPLKLLWFGTVRGNLDDVMYAVVNRTAEEAKVNAAYVESTILDFALLDTLVHPTVDDPFRGLQIKWAVNGGPALMRSMVRCRDFVYVEATGTTTISTGERIGFHLLHSIVIPGAPELHEHKLVRGDLTLFHFYRQRSEEVVETYVKAFVDLKGDMPLGVATKLATNGLVSVWKLGEYALMKKLNWHLAQRRSTLPTPIVEFCRVCKKIIRGSMVRRRTCKICASHCCARCCVPKKMFFVPACSRAAAHKTAHFCTECIKLASYANGADIALGELSEASGQIKAYTYWATISPTSSTSSMML
ncbi:hypothetical protein PHYSODRAFT_489963 [Phytophthora sojae]|uniref:FYVE-type domain-containing protein n=1 Tax=Phytophthora sojae (strain P6497) TaxID=1094619 RepID=G4Z892_PHYSP|nr:hypothetical protein PHYSODRAFT_489963 [Phytophthora sojae]EGZ20444.1 hypothetical protein PHYSODRAFT_489963 [Phytophthora sojae]|eukprot:XP_009523161.1 hypothetical protein PHYSODRAFT_489963 [Phytophthora sojae]